ncbi:hypothetical protein GLOIN_2v1656708, partial [Rhizophagus irregularis DAOM 181602=DAOM 197198]
IPHLFIIIFFNRSLFVFLFPIYVKKIHGVILLVLDVILIVITQLVRLSFLVLQMLNGYRIR